MSGTRVPDPNEAELNGAGQDEPELNWGDLPEKYSPEEKEAGRTLDQADDLEDLEEEFRKLTAGLAQELPDLGEVGTAPNGGDAHNLGADRAGLTDSMALQEPGTDLAVGLNPDLRAETSQDQTLLCNALVVALMPYAVVYRIYQLMDECEISIKVYPVDLQPYGGLFLRIPRSAQTDTDMEMAELLGEERPMPEAVDMLASSMAVDNLKIVAFAAWLHSDEDGDEPGITGQITARQYVGGKPDEFLPGGLVLAQIGVRAEELLLGNITPEELLDED